MAKSKKSDSGCLSSVLRHLLCGNGIPTYPSTELHHAPIKTDEGDSLEARGKEAAASSSSDRPGIVARLMGLETLPGDPSWAPKFRKSPSHVPRSRSVNFMDYLLEIDFGRVSDTRHRRVRTSVSFRESAPSLPCQQSLQPDLLVLYLDELESKPKKEARSKLSGQEPGLGDRKPKDRRRDGAGRELKVSKLRNEPRSVSKEAQHGRKNGSQRGKLIQEKEMMAESKFTKKRKEGKAVKRVAIVPVESDGSEASSPMSVLNLDEWANEQGTSTVQGTRNSSIVISFTMLPNIKMPFTVPYRADMKHRCLTGFPDWNFLRGIAMKFCLSTKIKCLVTTNTRISLCIAPSAP